MRYIIFDNRDKLKTLDKNISLYPKYMLIKHCHLNSAQVKKDTEKNNITNSGIKYSKVNGFQLSSNTYGEIYKDFVCKKRNKTQINISNFHLKNLEKKAKVILNNLNFQINDRKLFFLP